MLALSGIDVTVAGLHDVSLTVPEGAVVGVVGPNGAGKTTLLNVVCGLVTPQRGTITFDGVPLRPRPGRLARLGIARTRQGAGLFGSLSVVENVVAGTRPAPERLRHERAWAVLDELGLRPYGHDAPATLPYGLRKKVALARALALEPRLLLLDEPAGGLSAEAVDDLAALVTALPRRGCSVLLVEHDRDLVRRVCDEVVVLDLGRVVAAGAPDQLPQTRS